MCVHVLVKCSAKCIMPFSSEVMLTAQANLYFRFLVFLPQKSCLKIE